MPKMSPMNWLTLFFLFIVMIMIFNTLHYFSFMYTSKNKIFNKIKNSINEKW